MVNVLLILFQALWIVMTVVTVAQGLNISPENTGKGMTITKSRFTEASTNIEYEYISDYDDYSLFKLNYKYGSTKAQTLLADKLIEQFLQESFETPGRSYPNIMQWCGTTMLALFAQNVTISTRNINALLLARLEAHDNSQYVCFLSVLKQHRQKGLGTKLLNVFINEAIQAKNSRVTLNVNTENNSALSLYLKCGMRCNNFIYGYYFGDRTYATQNSFFMTLQTQNVKNSTAVCQSANAVEISQQEEALYRQRCPQASNG